MDTEARPDERLTERDRSSGPGTADQAGSGQDGRSRSARAFRDAPPCRRAGIRRAGILSACCLVVLLPADIFVAQPFEIPSSSMEPTLRPGDRVLVNKLAYRFDAEPRRGDVVVFDGTEYFSGSGDYVKRVVGVGGDRVVCCDRRGRVQVNGTAVEEPYLHPGDTPSDVSFDVVVPEGTLWLMGDHRSRSSDSRDRLGSPGGGMVPVERVVGRVEGIAWPPARWSPVDTTDAFEGVRDPAGAHG
ncbi:signal peptidase I [Streptomyces sp. GC420]|uniref:signal peptidase I n=1 Tax=Streptomyces sp. GC420 TaxID=2697568 RepID=UPI0014150CA3|nr:signal peptidase I [Streptomyces sp. GC420]NBM15187.1 signal peptidase I [Streptomyces sp. GC420]